MIINSESDVRRWVKKAYKGRVWWIEPRSGGTFGLPDCLIAFTREELKVLGYSGTMLGPVLTPVELKCADVKVMLSDKGQELSCSIDLRPAQKRVLGGLLAVGVKPVVMVGRRGTLAVGYVDAAEFSRGARTGKWTPIR